MSRPARPYVRSYTQARRVRYVLVEPTRDEEGREGYVQHRLGHQADPRAALEHLEAQLRDRERWAAPDSSPEEREELARAWRRHEELAGAVARYEAGRRGG